MKVSYCRGNDLYEHQTALPALNESLPDRVNAVLAQRLFLETKGLPSPILNQIKRLAAFANPEFYRRQSMRLSTALTPRIISCSEELPGHIGLPRGCLPALESLLGEWSVALRCEDKREGGSPLEVEFHGQLSSLQEKAVGTLLAHDTGVLVAPPGAGKTVVGAFLVAARKRNTLIIVHRKPLLTQWVEQLSHFLGIEKKDVGQIGGGKNTRNGNLDVAMLQSLFRRGQVSNLVEGYGQVIVDECHHVPSFSFEKVLSHMKSRYVAGLTATPQRRDGHHPIIFMQLGPIRHSAEKTGSKERLRVCTEARHPGTID